MLTSLYLENWKSFEKALLTIDPLTVMIGTNASGKSNALDALSFLNRIAAGSMFTAALQGDTGLSALRGGVEWAVRKPGSNFSLTVTMRAEEATDYEYRIECYVIDKRCELMAEQLKRIKFRVNKNGERKSESGRINLISTDYCPADGGPTIVARLYNEKRGTPRQLSRSNALLFQLVGQKLRQEIQDGVSHVVNTLRDIFILDPISSHMRGFSPLSEKIEPDARNIAGVIAALPKGKQIEIESVLTKYASKLPERDIKRVYAETVGKFNADAMLYCEEKWNDEIDVLSTVDARGMSDGTLRFLAILTALLTRPKNSLLVIEEVDNGLHPSRAKLLIEVLQTVGGQRGVDVLVTTHNPALLDAMGNRMVPFITVVHRDPLAGTSLLTLLEDIAQLPKLLAHGQIGQLSSEGLIEKTLSRQLSLPLSSLPFS